MIKEMIVDNYIIAEFAMGKYNAINLDTLRGIDRIVKKANTDNSIKGIIFTGAGKIFSSGFDLKMFIDFKDIKEVADFFKEEEKILTDLFMCRKPVISAINGHAIAGGLIIAMASDYRIAKNHPKIQISMSEIKLGLSLSVAQSEIMKFGLECNKRFRDVMYFGERYDVLRAWELEIIDEIVEGDRLISRSKEIISSWIDNPGKSFGHLKERLRKPVYDLIMERIKTENRNESLKFFFNDETRQALKAVYETMT